MQGIREGLAALALPCTLHHVRVLCSCLPIRGESGPQGEGKGTRYDFHPLAAAIAEHMKASTAFLPMEYCRLVDSTLHGACIFSPCSPLQPLPALKHEDMHVHPCAATGVFFWTKPPPSLGTRG